MSATTQRPYHHGNLRSELLSCAERALSEGGLAQLSLRDLARQVGVSHAAPRRHFADKQALLDALAQDGFDVVGTENGDTALELALRAHPDLVLLGDPSAVESFRGVPVIVIGGEDSDAIDRVRAFARGCDDFVARPFVYDELLARLGRASPCLQAHISLPSVPDPGIRSPKRSKR